MKFGKEFKKQMVPEWTEAYMDYNGLKRLLQDIQNFKPSKQPSTPLRTLHQKLTMYRTFSGLNLQVSNLQRQGDLEDQVIAVNTTQHEDSRKLYKTNFLRENEEGGEKEVTFFKKLDDELNKVNTFYKDKVDEVLSEAAMLNKQMDALIALRIKVEKPDFDGSRSLNRLSMDIATTMLSITSPHKGRTPGRGQMDLTHGVNMNGSCRQDECTASEVNTVLTLDSSIGCGDEMKASDYKPDPLEILDHVKINNTFESPISTIKGVLKASKEWDLSFSKEELRKVEERLKLVFIELYRKLRLLKHFSFMNLSAFSKIMKKYEKITTRGASRSYMKIVDDSYLGSSDEVTDLLERVEATFIKHFSNSNRREGMKSLRPKHRREKHRITFFTGFFSGCSLALLVAVFLHIASRKLMDKEATLYIEDIYPLYSLYAYIVLHMLLYAANIYFWRRYRINYPFIFGFKLGTELGYREVFLLGSGLAVLVLATFLAHLHLKMDPSAKDNEKYTKLVPLGLLTVVLVMTFCPFNILYRSSRLFLIRCMFRCVCAPLYKVILPDFFLADQLTSQIQAIRSFEFYICYYAFGEFSQRGNKCDSHDIAYNVFYFIVAVIPYWVRFLQCLRRVFEDRDVIHRYNALRYFLTIVAVLSRTAFELSTGISWKVLAVVSSAAATVMNTYWDIMVDWGLLQRQSRNFCLRDKLSVPHKSVYFVAMALDILLRFAWLQLLLKFDLHSLRGRTFSGLVSCLEILRRGIWNFFRLENEHLNNVGKYRAFKSVPLPFNYYDVEDDIGKDD